MNNKHSRLTKKEEVKAYRKLILLFLTIAATAVLFALVGIPLLISISSFITSVSDSSKPILQIKDAVAPFPPRFDTIPEATNSSTLAIKGYSEPGSTVKLMLDGSTANSLISDNEGNFTNTLSLHPGLNVINAIAIDQADNQSIQSQTYNLILKTTPPSLEVQEPNEGKTISGSNKDINVSGKTEQGASVTVNDRYTSVDQDGKFQTTIVLNPGENTIKVVSKDKAGNETKIERKVNYNP